MATKNPEAEIKRLKEELRLQKQIYLRAVADCDNYRKRVERERARDARKGKRDVILSFLDTLDELERILKHAESDPNSLLEGVQVLYRLLLNRMATEGVTQFKSLGENFNPELHEAVGSLPREEENPSGVVVDELRTGYRWEDEILRPARVIVAQ